MVGTPYKRVSFFFVALRPDALMISWSATPRKDRDGDDGPFSPTRCLIGVIAFRRMRTACECSLPNLNRTSCAKSPARFR
jgi:hypothetical protein